MILYSGLNYDIEYMCFFCLKKKHNYSHIHALMCILYIF